jgi:membrane-associated phospholipid phosphatase
MNIADLISTSVGMLYAIPIILYIFTSNILHLKALLGLASTAVISEFLKHNVIKTLSVRPKGASDCNLMCNDGNQGGQPGMPSSHSAQVAFFSFFYYNLTDNILLKSILIIYAAMVMLSRYVKKCHTVYQIIAGSTLGILIAWFLVRQL